MGTSLPSMPAPAGDAAPVDAVAAAVDAATPAIAPRGRRRQVLLGLAVGWLVLLAVAAAAADLLPLRSYGIAVGAPHLRPSVRHLEFLGTDDFGRSELSRVIYGARVSLVVGVLSTVLGMCFGGLVGMIAGYFRGRIDACVSVVLDAVLSFPPIVLLLTLAAVLKPSVTTVVVSIGVVMVPYFARLARANTIRFAGRDSITAARLMGAGHVRILTREILPNTIAPVASYAFLMVAVAIAAESAISFLGLGIQPPQPSWGAMIDQGRDSLATDAHLVLVPGVTMLLTIFSFNVVGDSFRARFDPRRESAS